MLWRVLQDKWPLAEQLRIRRREPAPCSTQQQGIRQLVPCASTPHEHRLSAPRWGGGVLLHFLCCMCAAHIVSGSGFCCLLRRRYCTAEEWQAPHLRAFKNRKQQCSRVPSPPGRLLICALHTWSGMCPRARITPHCHHAAAHQGACSHFP